MVRSRNNKKKISIALQGGGSHGAFAWGVLDRLLEEEERIQIVGISGTSAGAMNAAAAVQGLTKGNAETAKQTLAKFWQSLRPLSGVTTPYQPTWFDRVTEYNNLDHSPSYYMAELARFFFSPYEFNPLGLNPFYEFLDEFFDYECLRQSSIGLFLATTEVQTGKIKIWDNKTVSSKVLMASACLPYLYQAVEIDGKAYWDGGYIANPAIFPLIDSCDCPDIVVIQLNRLQCDKIPKTRAEIEDRLREITFNGCLVREMRAIHLITKLIDQGVIKEGTMTRLNLHVIRNEKAFDGLNKSSAMNTEPEFLANLHDKGYQTAHKWLQDHFDDIGMKKPIDSIDNIFDDFV